MPVTVGFGTSQNSLQMRKDHNYEKLNRDSPSHHGISGRGQCGVCGIGGQGSEGTSGN
jgi:hypothetical protein